MAVRNEALTAAVATLDSRRLVDACHDDAEAFSGIVESYYDGLCSHALRRLGDIHAAEDAVQEALLRAYRALPRFNGEYQLRAWLHRILSNVCNDEGSRRRRESGALARVTGGPDEAAPPDDGLDRLDVPRHQLLDALAALPEPYRQAIILRYVDELSFREVAKATGVSEGSARVRVFRGRAALRRALASSLPLVAWLVPGFRRAQRGALDATQGSGLDATMTATMNAVQAAPHVGRMVESTAMFTDRIPAVAGLLGMAATVAVPAVGNRVIDAAPTRPPAVIVEVGEAVDRDPGAVVVPEESRLGDASAAAAGSGSNSGSGSATAEAPHVTGTTVAPGTAVGDAAPGPGVTLPGAPPPLGTEAPFGPVFNARLDAATLTDTGDGLVGPVQLRLGAVVVAGTLRGSIDVAPPLAPAPPTGEVAPAPRPLTGEFLLELDDGRVLRLVLIGSLGADGSTVTGGFEAFDQCATALGEGTLSGKALLAEAPLPSRLHLRLDGDGPGQVPPAGCTAGA